MNTRNLIAIIAAFGLLTITPQPAPAQPVAWTQQIVSGPSPRDRHAMAYDTARGVTVLFGGGIAGGYSGETWEWNGTAWTQRMVSGPSPRARPAMAYDSARGVTVLFGGGNAGGSSGETWEWNGTEWAQRMVAGPSPREGPAMTYDPVRGVTVLFGGFTDYFNAETWEWDGNAWTQRVVSGPTARIISAMAYDTARGVTVLFGGYGAGPNGETWEWNGTAWTQRVVSGPTPRSGHAMAYDAARGVTVVFGGQVTSGAPNGETWEWNGTAWFQRVIGGPSPRFCTAMAYDSARGAIFLFGGDTNQQFMRNGETWRLGPPCTAPSITSQPSARSACPSGSANFAVTAAGTGPFSYQWQLQTAPGVWQGLGNDPLPLPCGGGAFAYATPINSPTVTIGIHPCPGVTHYQVRAVVTNACGTATSNEATYTICPADFNCSGVVNSQDFFDFLAAFFTLDPSADFNHSGAVDSQDFFDFLTAFFAGC